MVPDPIPEELLRRRRMVGARIRALREEHGISQERLAEAAGIARVTVVRIELGIQSPRLDHLFLIADALRAPLAHLVRE